MLLSSANRLVEDGLGGVIHPVGADGGEELLGGFGHGVPGRKDESSLPGGRRSGRFEADAGGGQRRGLESVLPFRNPPMLAFCLCLVCSADPACWLPDEEFEFTN